MESVPAKLTPNAQVRPAPGPLQVFLRNVAIKIVRLLVTGLILGFVYNWAAPRLYPDGVTAGFWWGAAHGALMPVALPTLLGGRDVPIFTERNTGRSYKLGYIAGINLCGFIFFGLAFANPPARRRPPENSASAQA